MAFSKILIPKERINSLIGRNGTVRKIIEEKTGVKLFIHSALGEVDISGQDSLGIMDAEQVIKAIGRGFNPSVAFKLFEDEYVMEIIDISDFKVKSKNRKLTLRGRIIGKKGITRRIIEQYTGCWIAVFGKTVSIIGDSMNISYARQAIEMILEGSEQGTAYKFLKKVYK